MASTRTLNAFQRRYFAWAAPHYARMAPPLRHEVECLDRWLYSRAGLRFWLSLVGAILGVAIALRATGAGWALAIPAAVSAAIALLFVSLGAWLQPDRYTLGKLLKFSGTALLLAWLGAAAAFVAIHFVQGGDFDAAAWTRLRDLFVRKAVPVMVLLLLVLGLLLWTVAAIRRFQLHRELAAMRLTQERDAAARQLAEARLKLLQGQIQPHFVFNTLAAIQHWVDEGDPRAGPLLRALTSFLRGSTELLGQESVALAVEIETVRHYLSIMAARLGDRLHHDIAIEPAAGAERIAPGIVLTLVENAIEHGIAPALHGGVLRVAARRDGGAWVLEVRNDGVPLAPDWHDGIGLANSRERLAHLFGARATLTLRTASERPTTSGTVATVRIAHEDPA